MISEFELYLIAVAGSKGMGKDVLSYLHFYYPKEPIDGHVPKISRMEAYSIQETRMHKTIVSAMIMWLSNNTSIFTKTVSEITKDERFMVEGKFNRILFLKTFK